MSDYKMTIGLEIHAELKTRTKMFCGCINLLDEKEPNIHVCPICMGHPGTLPVINKEAVKKVLLVGTALNSNLADFTEFDRKNYFYPDIPKGYQISQYKYPLVSGGSLLGIEITRIHLEEDTARSTHDNVPGKSLVDFNRAGVPLMELVTEPVIHSADGAMNFAKELQLLLQYLDVSEANMEKGQMRVEVNLSISNTDKFGTKVEIKNLNSFKAVGKAIEFEYKRQSDILSKGEKVVQETRGWDENKNITFSQRTKENANDYRYFPDPDLPKLMISEEPDFSSVSLKSQMPELPDERRERYFNLYNLKKEDIESYVNNFYLASFFEEVASFLADNNLVRLASNYIVSDVVGLSKSSDSNNLFFGKIKADKFADLINMINSSEISSRAAKDILKIMFEDGGDAREIANEKKLIQKSDPEELKIILKKIIDNNPMVVADYKSGKDSVIQFFVGQGMKESRGSANPEILKQIALELLK